MRAKLIFLIPLAFGLCTVSAQSPAPVIVPAQTGTVSTTAAAPARDETTQASLKVLLELKAANEETLKKQKAALDTLDELQKAAEQIKIYARRS
jgi:hypothetical protein